MAEGQGGRNKEPGDGLSEEVKEDLREVARQTANEMRDHAEVICTLCVLFASDKAVAMQRLDIMVEKMRNGIEQHYADLAKRNN